MIPASKVLYYLSYSKKMRYTLTGRNKRDQTRGNGWWKLVDLSELGVETGVTGITGAFPQGPHGPHGRSSCRYCESAVPASSIVFLSCGGDCAASNSSGLHIALRRILFIT